MFETVRNAFKIKDIRKRLFFTFLMLVVIRIGSELPIPGINHEVFREWYESKSSDAFSFFDAITGGSFLNMSVFALNITPYINASIIMQLLTIAIPKLEEIQRDGEEGRKKIVEITRYLTVGLALIEAIAMGISFGRSGYLTEFTFLNTFEVITALVAGSAVLMWLGERITEKGIGNGISIVLVINIISRIPDDLSSLYEQFVKGKTVARMVLAIVIIAVIILAIVVLVVVLQDAERRIPVQYSRKMQGRRQVGGNSSHIPLKVNTGGVIPVIFAQSIMQFPVVIAQLVSGSSSQNWVFRMLSQSNWCNPANMSYSIGLVIYIVLIIAFAYFYTSITFNPLEIADNMKKAGGFIPGIRPGKPTSDYLTKILNYIVFIGAAGLAFVTFLPIFFNGVFGASVSFGGTSLIIIVGVIIETLKQVESMMTVRYYKGFLTD